MSVWWGNWGHWGDWSLCSPHCVPHSFRASLPSPPPCLQPLGARLWQNSAGAYGGGIALGNSSNPACQCSLSLGPGAEVADNKADKGAARAPGHVFNSCTGNVTLGPASGARVALGLGPLPQFLMPRGGGGGAGSVRGDRG